MKQIIEQWNARTLNAEQSLVPEFEYTLKPTQVSNGTSKCHGIKIEFKDDVGVKYLAFLLQDDLGNLCVEYAFYTKDTGICYLDKKRVNVEVDDCGTIITPISTAPLCNALSKLKKYKPVVTMDEALAVLQYHIHYILLDVNEALSSAA